MAASSPLPSATKPSLTDTTNGQQLARVEGVGGCRPRVADRD